MHSVVVVVKADCHLFPLLYCDGLTLARCLPFQLLACCLSLIGQREKIKWKSLGVEIKPERDHLPVTIMGKILLGKINLVYFNAN